jgi:hypothetical protein
MTTGQLVVLIVVLVAVAAGAIIFFMRNRSGRLRSRFGPEYERAVDETGSRLKAEARLEKLEKRVEKYSLRPLSIAERDRFQQSWRSIQSTFVDDPSSAFAEADQLLMQVMSARGYPMGDFANRAEEISVDHASVVQNYRAGHDVALRHRQGGATTEELRQGMIHYRVLFDELTGSTATVPPDVPRSRTAVAR